MIPDAIETAAVFRAKLNNPNDYSKHEAALSKKGQKTDRFKMFHILKDHEPGIASASQKSVPFPCDQG